MPLYVNLAKHLVNKRIFYFFFLTSLGLMLFAQPDISLSCCMTASLCGFAFFWRALCEISQRKKRFFLALFWFALISFVHLSWLTADRYVGWYIYIFLNLWVGIIGSFFALLSLLIPRPEKVTYSKAFQIASLWTMFEWARLFLLSGFSWNPVGLMMTAHVFTLQSASLIGIFGLSFLIMVTNMICYRLFAPKRCKRNLLYLLILACTPYLLGFWIVTFHEKRMIKEKKDPLSVLLVQTSLYPEEKIAYQGMEGKMIPLYDQWGRIFHLLKEHENKKIDLIVLSEAAVPYGTYLPIYSQKEALQFFKEYFPQFSLSLQIAHEELVGNAYFAQSLSTHFNTDLVIGMEDGGNKKECEIYNAAFLFHPDQREAKRYEKRVLVPLGEYIPFSFCKKFLASYGIFDSFTPGKEAKVFLGGKTDMGLSICYEETYGHLMRENRQKGAKILVNLTNDVWYPHSRLPIVHFHHGRVRAVEGGLPMVRASNTGVTCAIDSLGRVVDMLDYEKRGQKSPFDALFVYVPTYSYHTLYMYLGDITIITICILCLILYPYHPFVRKLY